MTWRTPHMDPEVIQHHTEVIQASEIRAQAIPLKDEVKVLPCLQADQDAARWILVNSIPYHSEQNHLTKTCVKVCPQLIEKTREKNHLHVFHIKKSNFYHRKNIKTTVKKPTWNTDVASPWSSEWDPNGIHGILLQQLDGAPAIMVGESKMRRLQCSKQRRAVDRPRSEVFWQRA